MRCQVHVLQAGLCRHPEGMAMAGASLCAVDFPALTALIIHPVEGPLLWDTGYDPAFFRATRRWPESLYRLATPVTLTAGESINEQIGRFGLAPGDINGVVLSHFHGDHISGLHAFPAARIHCARAGLDQIRATKRLRGVSRGLLPALVPDDVETRALFFEDQPRRALPPALAPFDSGADILGDGSLLAVDLPGHCAGHYGLVLRGDDDRIRFLVGDAAWSLQAVRENRPPPGLTTALLGSTEPYRRTLHDLHLLARRAPEVDIIPSHCREAAKAANRG